MQQDRVEGAISGCNRVSTARVPRFDSFPVTEWSPLPRAVLAGFFAPERACRLAPRIMGFPWNEEKGNNEIVGSPLPTLFHLRFASRAMVNWPAAYVVDGRSPMQNADKVSPVLVPQRPHSIHHDCNFPPFSDNRRIVLPFLSTIDATVTTPPPLRQHQVIDVCITCRRTIC